MAQTSTEKKIRPAYDAVMTALKGWSLWSEKIQTFVMNDAERKQFLQIGANISRCPMIAAAWDATNPTWWVYSQQEWLCPLRLSIYVPYDRHSLAMDLIDDAIDAVFRFEAPNSTAAGPVPLIKQATCRDPEIMQFQAGLYVELGEEQQHKLLMSEVVIRLSLRKDLKLRGQ